MHDTIATGGGPEDEALDPSLVPDESGSDDRNSIELSSDEAGSDDREEDF